VDGYSSTSLPTVSIGGVTLTEGTQYIAAVDTTNHVAYIKLMEPLVPALRAAVSSSPARSPSGDGAPVRLRGAPRCARRRGQARLGHRPARCRFIGSKPRRACR